MRELRTLGSVRGASSNGRSYRDRAPMQGVNLKIPAESRLQKGGVHLSAQDTTGCGCARDG